MGTLWRRLIGLAASTAIAALALGGEADDARHRAIAAWQEGDFTNAFQIVNQALAASPHQDRLVNLRAHMHALRHEDKEALADFNLLAALAPESGSVRQERARVLFRMARFDEALTDFDGANRLEPKFAPFNWERGIALYFAGRYADARSQFELHQTVNTNDVENAVWHFLCVAKLEDIGAARRKLIPIIGDDRALMADVHRMFAGLLSAEDLLSSVPAGEPKEGSPDTGAFHARLYAGLYLELTGKWDQAQAQYSLAAKLAAPEEFMAVVAKLAAARLAAAGSGPQKGAAAAIDPKTPSNSSTAGKAGNDLHAP